MVRSFTGARECGCQVRATWDRGETTLEEVETALEVLDMLRDGLVVTPYEEIGLQVGLCPEHRRERMHVAHPQGDRDGR